MRFFLNIMCIMILDMKMTTGFIFLVLWVVQKNKYLGLATLARSYWELYKHLLV